MNILRKFKILFISSGLLILIFIAPSAFGLTPGDVNDNAQIDIIDALLTAQYAAGFKPTSFNVVAAEVSNDGSVTIIDALLIARYSVGLISQFPISTPSPTPTPTPVNLLTINQASIVSLSVSPSYPATNFTLNLQNQADGSNTNLSWQFYELPATTIISIGSTAGTITSGATVPVSCTVDWTRLTPGNTHKYEFYLYATTNTNKRYCKLLTFTFVVPPSEPGPTATPTPVPCGFPDIRIANGIREISLNYPSTNYTFQIWEYSSTTQCSGSFAVVIPEPQKAYMSVQPASGVPGKAGPIIVSPTPTSGPTASPTMQTPTPIPTPAPSPTAGVVIGTLNWQEVPAGTSLDYFCIVKINPYYNTPPSRHLITIHANRP